MTLQLNTNLTFSQETALPRISIEPSYTKIGEEGLNLSEVPPFKVTVVLENVEDLFAWQVGIFLNPRILSLTSVSKPESNYIFEGLSDIWNYTTETWFVLMKNITAIDFENPVGTKLWVVEKSGTIDNPTTPKGKIDQFFPWES